MCELQKSGLKNTRNKLPVVLFSYYPPKSWYRHANFVTNIFGFSTFFVLADDKCKFAATTVTDLQRRHLDKANCTGLNITQEAAVMKIPIPTYGRFFLAGNQLYELKSHRRG